MDNNAINEEPLKMNGETEKKTEKKAIRISFKTMIVLVAIIAIGALVYVGKGWFIVATVDGSPISRLSIIGKLEKASGKTLLNTLITEKLIQNEAKAKGIVVSEEEVNSEIKKVQDQVVVQGNTLEAALAAQGMDMQDLKGRIILQKDLEKLLADKTNVTDSEVEQYIKDNKVSVPKGQETAMSAQVRDALVNQKLAKEADTLIAALKSRAKIQYFVNY
ncbi:MAG: SurA N-terminal domain-containing protein [bacterium]|nr:SurA N-terminal domain-containing protein [bacterium]